MIDFEPDEEQSLIVETVRQFAENEIRPLARECDESGKLPDATLAHAHELGLVANSLPEEMGGGGQRCAVTGCLIAEELAWGDLSIALAILSPTLLGLPLADFGTADQRKSQLPGLCGGTFQDGSLAIVEPRFDFDVFRPQTTARRDGDDYLLVGKKCFVPWLGGDSPVLVVASEDGQSQAYLVPRDASGLSATPEGNMGIKGLPTVELALEGVRVPKSARLGGSEGADLRAIVNRGRVGLAAAAVGVSRAAFETARDYAKQRETFGAPIATRQAIAFILADMAIEIDGARLLVWEAASRLDRGLNVDREATLAHDQAQRVSLQVADGAVQVLGGHGYTREYLPEMHLRNAAGFASLEALTLV
jgi:alkylation response protein AidB-like acyl-CoA dehydrogenase